MREEKIVSEGKNVFAKVSGKPANNNPRSKDACIIEPCCPDPGPIGPGAYRVEELVLGTPERENWGINAFKIREEIDGNRGTGQNKPRWKDIEGEGIKVAVLDTGIALNHFDFYEKGEVPNSLHNLVNRANILKLHNGFLNTMLQWGRALRDFITNRSDRLPGAILKFKDFTGSPFGVLDIYGHGTHVAGIIAARENAFGVVGVAPKAKLLIGKVLSDTGSGSYNALAKGIRWAIREEADIICMSLGYRENEAPGRVRRVIQEAADKGIYVICSAGNKSPGDQNSEAGEGEEDTLLYPAKFPETIAVGAMDREGGIPWYSPGKDIVDIVAPGDKIVSSFPPLIGLPGHICAVLSGTSMAAAFVSGVAALILAKHKYPDKYACDSPVADRDDLIEHLKTVAIDAALYGSESEPGKGFDLIDPGSVENLMNSK